MKKLLLFMTIMIPSLGFAQTPSDGFLHDASIQKSMIGVKTGVQSSNNPTIWSGSVATIGTPSSAGQFVGADLPLTYTTSDGGGSGAVAQADMAEAVNVTVLTAGSCPATTGTLSINGTNYGTISISGDLTVGQVITVDSPTAIATSIIPDSSTYMQLPSNVYCTVSPVLRTTWTPTHAVITNAGAGYTSLPTFTSAQSSISTLAQSTIKALTLSSTQTVPVVQSQAALPSGVNTLNTRGEVINPVNTTTINGTTSTSIGYQNAIPINMVYNGWQGDYSSHKPGPRITAGVYLGSGQADQMFSVGGHRLYDSVFSKFYALPYGVGDAGGCVHSSVMTYAPGTGANCGAGGWDAVTEYELATNNPPWYMTGAEMPDENGTGHDLTFTSNGLYIRPALPSSYKDYMHANAHIMTNIVAGSTIYSGTSLDGVQSHMNQDQQFYGNTVINWTDGSDSTGTYTYLSMSGQWQPISGDAVDNGHIPTVGSSNTTAIKDSDGNVTNSADVARVDALDQVQYSEFKKPVVMIGTYIKHFARNTSCEVVIKDGTDGEAVKRYGASRKCDEELDNWYTGPDYGATMHGLTIGSGFSNKVSNDSYGLSVSGAWPTGIRSWVGSDGYDFDGDEYVTGSRIGSPAVIGSKKMIAQWLQEPTANIGYLEQMQIWSQTDSISQTNNSTINGPAAIGSDISYWFGPRQSATKYHVDGSYESAIAFNPNWSKNGIALCGYQASGYFGTSTEGTACLTVGTWGDVSTSGSITANNGGNIIGDLNVKGNLNVKNGDSLYLYNSDNSSSAYIFLDSDGTVHSSVGYTIPSININGSSSLDSGKITTDGSGNMTVNSIKTASEGSFTTSTFTTASGVSGSYSVPLTSFPSNGVYKIELIITGVSSTSGNYVMQAFGQFPMVVNGTSSASSSNTATNSYNSIGSVSSWSVAAPGFNTNAFTGNVSATDGNTAGTWTWNVYVKYVKISSL